MMVMIPVAAGHVIDDHVTQLTNGDQNAECVRSLVIPTISARRSWPLLIHQSQVAIDTNIWCSDTVPIYCMHIDATIR